MGSASSKATRAFPVKSGKSPSWGGARMPAHDPKTSPLPTARQPLASESKDEAIQRDARDPQLLANLNRLGPVRVDHHMQTVRTANFKELFESRARAEDQAASMRIPRNHLLVSSLVALLEERQKVLDGGGAGDALGQLAAKYKMDVERLESLARSVNVPRVREGGVRSIRDAQSGEETVISEVEWRESVSPLES